MINFFSDVIKYQFLQTALLAAIFSSFLAGSVGTLTVVRRSTYLAGAISHAVFGGLGAARYLQIVYHLEWFSPLLGAIIAALTASAIISLATIWFKERMDSVLSLIWALGMSIGIIFIMKTPAYNQDLMGYLFGNILMVSYTDIFLMLILTFIVISFCVIFYNKILVLSFNEELAFLKDIPTTTLTFIILFLTSLSIVFLTIVTGTVLVIALLSIPAAIASRFFYRLSQVMITTTLLSLVFNISGLMISYHFNLPVGATTVLIGALFYCIALLLRRK
ncbi:MAG: metal ABC transporter permease [Chitinispirillaceae bacterium]|nr:metal ABC transporter permease [Chitinispirillaceae bacterium]